jgi:amidase
VIQFNEENKDQVMPYFGQERMITSQEKGPLSSAEYRQARSLSRKLTRTEGIDQIIKQERLDAIVALSGGPAWMVDMVNGDSYWDTLSTSAPAVAGYPHITVPGGYLFGLPIGISFISRAWCEPTLLRIAYAFEQELNIRKPPKFLKTIKL